jgi:hypothetical protein
VLVIKLENIALHAAPDDYNPYSAQTNLHGLPSKFGPHSLPATNHIFFLQGAFKYALPMSQDIMSRPFSAAIRNAILTLSLDTTLEYVIDGGVSVI